MPKDIHTTEDIAYMICTMLNLRSVDLNLLPVFEAAYEERSLSRAAERLAMTQPAVSHAMNRLRSLFKDELFVRQSRGVLPTPVADLVYANLRDALVSVRPYKKAWPLDEGIEFLKSQRGRHFDPRRVDNSS